MSERIRFEPTPPSPFQPRKCHSQDPIWTVASVVQMIVECKTTIASLRTSKLTRSAGGVGMVVGGWWPGLRFGH